MISLPLVFSWGIPVALAQNPPPDPIFAPQPPFGPGQPQPGQPQPGQPQPGQPQPGQPQPGPQPGQPGQPAPGSFGGTSAPGQFGPQPGQPGQPGFGQPYQPVPAPAPADKKKEEWKEREFSLIYQNSFTGTTGLMRTSAAGSGAAGTFRVGFMFDWFTADGFLCDPADTTAAGAKITCSSANREDNTSHVGGFFSLSATPLSFLEAYANIRTYANANTEGSPQLLQVLGDTTIGVKGFTPFGLIGPLQIGAEANLLLLNGTGDVGVSGGATSGLFKINATADFRKMLSAFPLRVHLNAGYKVDNSGVAVENVEKARAQAFNDGRDFQPITRIERYGLGINKVDFFQTYLGVDVDFSFIQPFVEYTVDVPVNRQGYECYTNRVSRGDVCLGLSDLSDPNSGSVGYEGIPSRLGFGVRVSPFQAISGTGYFRGLSALIGAEVGLSGTSTFVEEIAPNAPWTLYLGIGYAFDTRERPVEQPVQLPAPPPVVLPAPQNFIRGLVHEQGKQDGIPNAIVAFQGAVQPPVATGADGRFLSRHVEPGTYTFDISAPGYKPGTCTVSVTPMQQPMPYNPQSAMPAIAPPPQPQGNTFADADCVLEALPRTGNIDGTIKDAVAGGPIASANITATDSLGKEYKTTADSNGKFRFDGLPPGEVSLRVEATGFMNHVADAEVRANEDAHPTVSMNKRPKNALVRIQGNEIKLSEKILFETDSAKILGQSSALLEEIAEVLNKNPNIEEVEIQGHTDNTGGADHNQRLSEARANSVREWLVKAGVAAGRLTPKGYGQSMPLVPNVTDANKAKNRRVQFIILKNSKGKGG
ncbi:MAG: carboxypeptidase regulatory-like domain-containing protein [Polyangiaceae bacterium]